MRLTQCLFGDVNISVINSSRKSCSNLERDVLREFELRVQLLLNVYKTNSI